MASNIFLLESNWSAPSHLRPLTLFFIPFLHSKPHHVEKYLSLYADFYQFQHPRPLHVYLQMPNVADFLIMAKTASDARKHLVNFKRHLDPADKVLMHGMSIGCFLQAATLTHDKNAIFKNPLGISLKNRIVGQFYDSPVYGGSARFGLDRMVLGMLRGVENPVLKKALLSSFIACLSISSARMMEYDGFIESFINESPVVPTLAMSSEQDPLCDEPLFLQKVIQTWQDRARGRGVKISYNCFPGNSHANILKLYPDEYKRLFFEYLNEVQNLLDVYDEIQQLGDEEGVEEEKLSSIKG